jgi:uncharacterized protein YycO
MWNDFIHSMRAVEPSLGEFATLFSNIKLTIANCEVTAAKKNKALITLRNRVSEANHAFVNFKQIYKDVDKKLNQL